MGKADKNSVLEVEQLAATITEGTKSTLKDILSEAVSNYLREEVLNEDDKEDEEAEETPVEKTSDVEEFDETSDETENVEEDPEEADEVEETDVEVETTEDDGDEWSDFSDYKIGEGEGSEEYDFTNETDPNKLIKVFKLMKNDDQVSVVKDGDKVSIKDNEADTEYVIELDADGTVEDLENDEITMAESLGYTDNYQDKDAIEGLSMDNTEPKNTKKWDKGVPTGTEKPWAGKGDNKPFEQKVEKVFEITLNDGVDVEEDEPIEENATTSKYQQRRMVKTMVPDNAYVQDGAHEVSQGGKLKVESLQKKVNAALLENKQLKETVAKVSKIMKEAVQVNVNLGHIVRLMVENSTTKSEKEDIVKRFNNVKSNDEAKALYESISSELKKSHSTVMTEQTTTVESSKKINESKIYDEPNSVRDMMKRMGMI
jgi:hypothetical protein